MRTPLIPFTFTFKRQTWAVFWTNQYNQASAIANPQVKESSWNKYNAAAFLVGTLPED
jgi:hypothetical protein